MAKTETRVDTDARTQAVVVITKGLVDSIVRLALAEESRVAVSRRKRQRGVVGVVVVVLLALCTREQPRGCPCGRTRPFASLSLLCFPESLVLESQLRAVVIVIMECM
jgi:hypothetical protein